MVLNTLNVLLLKENPTTIHRYLVSWNMWVRKWKYVNKVTMCVRFGPVQESWSILSVIGDVLFFSLQTKTLVFYSAIIRSFASWRFFTRKLSGEKQINRKIHCCNYSNGGVFSIGFFSSRNHFKITCTPMLKI